jgi:malate synthase
VAPGLEFRRGVRAAYPDLFGPEALRVLAALAEHEAGRRELMAARLARRRERARARRAIGFLPEAGTIGRTAIRVADARAGRFEGSAIPPDLERQWIQGTGPATRPRASVGEGLRSVAYALLSGADGWMFDGEDALGQVDTMALDNLRNLKLAFAREPLFLEVAAGVAHEMNAWARAALGRELVADPAAQLDFTTRLYRPRGLHLADRHVRAAGAAELGAALVDLGLYLANCGPALRAGGRTLALYLPKIQTAEEAAFWRELLEAAEAALGLPAASVRVYVLVEQLEACFQLMEIRAALGRHFVGFNTGRWDYIHSVADARAWDPEFVHPQIDRITMTWGHMRHYEERVRRAVNTPDRNGRCALWQGGMEANIPVGSARGVEAGMARALAGAERERAAGASGKWVAHWKMVPVVRPVWERAGEANQLGRSFPPLGYGEDDARALTLLEPAPRTVDGARDLVSVGLQYANAFLSGFQAAALKPADHFGNEDVLYLMEDMATAEIRLGILWEWLHKGAAFDADDAATDLLAGDCFDRALSARLLDEEHEKLRRACDRDVHDDSKETTLPIARAAVEAYLASPAKPPWAIDLLNLNLNLHDLAAARARLARCFERFERAGQRTTENLDFEPESPGESTP